MSLELVSADKYTIEELTEAYNQTRVDYLVPMPMNAARLAEYIHLYDINLEQSLVALQDGEIAGLGMLGIRANRSWITRLGLIPKRRGRGAGQLLTEGLLNNSDKLGLNLTVLEVIKGNEPAHRLFIKLKFVEQTELLILRRAPEEIPNPSMQAIWMDRGESIFHLKRQKMLPAWTNQTESMAKAKGVAGFKIEHPNGGDGWLIFQKTLFNLSRLVFKTNGGDPIAIMTELLKHLHYTHPKLDTFTENVPGDDPHLEAFEELGYFEAFRRIEMYRIANLAQSDP